MPEIVEVENFLHHFVPLISQKCPIQIECPSTSPPKIFLSETDVKFIEKCCISKLERKGKLIRIHLQRIDKGYSQKCRSSYLYFHMGMTGRISTPKFIPTLESLSDNVTYPPPYTHLILKSNGHEIAFSDPRKFGSVSLNGNGPLETQWGEFAVDAMDESACFDGFIGKTKGIKALLLDQRAVISGVGNWIADEVLYQCKIHPDQTFLTKEETMELKEKLQYILKTGIQCLDNREEFPNEWIFQSRWKKRSKEKLKDYHGHSIVFVTSAGRTSAIVPALQKKLSRTATESNSGEDSIQNHKTNKTKERKANENTKKRAVKATPASNELIKRRSRRHIPKRAKVY